MSYVSVFGRCNDSDSVDGRVERAGTTGACLHVYVFVCVCEFIDSIGAIEG